MIKSPLHLPVIVLCLVLSGCGILRAPEDRAADTLSRPDADAPKTYNVPTGDEIALGVERTDPKQAVLTVRNVSSQTIYVPFLPGPDTDWARLGCEGLEELTPETGEFDPTGCRIAGLGFHALEAGNSLKFLIRVPENGTYRVNFAYYSDSDLVERINNYHQLTEPEKEVLRGESEQAAKTVRSEPFELQPASNDRSREQSPRNRE